jgi:CRISPR-associated protein Csb1
MTVDLQSLLSPSQSRLLFSVDLEPIQTRRFQPTGFPDLGPALYQAGDTACLLVESAQSMANRLEEVCWDRPTMNWSSRYRDSPRRPSFRHSAGKIGADNCALVTRGGSAPRCSHSGFEALILPRPTISVS